MLKNLLLVSTLAGVSFANAADLDYKKEGAICDKKAGFCVDHMGVSMGITKLYLGEKAEQKLMAQINQVGLENFDATTFTMTSGLTCKTMERTCWTRRYGGKVDAKATRTLFGK